MVGLGFQNSHKPYFSSQLGKKTLILVIVEVFLRPQGMEFLARAGFKFQSLL